MLVSEFLENDVQAVALIARWARSVVGHRAWGFDAPEDIVQTVLLALVRNLREGRFAGGDLRAYVRRIAKNLCVSSLRRKGRAGTPVSLEQVPEVLVGRPAAGLDAASCSMVRRSLAALDEACRELILLAYVWGWSRREIAEKLGISEVTAKVRLFRCIERARAAQEAR